MSSTSTWGEILILRSDKMRLYPNTALPQSAGEKYGQQQEVSLICISPLFRQYGENSPF